MADELKRFRKGVWDVCWVDTGEGDNLEAFLKSIPAGAKKVIEAHLYVISLYGPAGQCKPIAGQDGLFEIKEIHNRNYYRIFCFYSKRRDAGKLFILGSSYLKKTNKIPAGVLKRALDIKRRAESLPPPP